MGWNIKVAVLLVSMVAVDCQRFGSSQFGSTSQQQGIPVSLGHSGTSSFLQSGIQSGSGRMVQHTSGQGMRSSPDSVHVPAVQTTFTQQQQQQQQHFIQPIYQQQQQPQGIIIQPQQQQQQQQQQFVVQQQAPVQHVFHQAPVQQPVQTFMLQQAPSQQHFAHAPVQQQSFSGMPGMPMMGGMMGAMDPMSAIMGAMGGMGMGGMAMGMPFMSYDTLEDMLDIPDRTMMRGVAMPAMATGNTMMSGPGAHGVPHTAGFVSAGFPQSAPAAPAVSAAVQTIGSGAHAAPSTGALGQGAAPAGGIDPSVIASALQTALSRVQQRGAATGNNNNNNQIVG